MGADCMGTDSIATSADLVALLDACYGAVTSAAQEASDLDLLRPTGCAGWNAADLLMHQMLDARRALVTFATPQPGPPDTDAVTYWKAGAQPLSSETDEAAKAHASHIRRLVVAYARPSGIVREWHDTSGAACRAASLAALAGCFGTQGHILTGFDVVSTLVVEATIHLLDLSVALPAAQPPEAALRHTADTLSAVWGAARPPSCQPRTFVQAATGRRDLTPALKAQLGPHPAPLRL